MNVTNVIGMYLRSPPMSFFMSKEWCEPEWLTEPAPRNSSALKNACVKRWNTAPVHAPTPRPITMYPSWLIVEYARTFLMSSCTNASAAPMRIVIATDRAPSG